MGRSFTVASWNVHAGVDGWGRTFDVAGGIARLDADLTVVVEAFEPDAGAALMAGLGKALAAEVRFVELGRGRRQGPNPAASTRWMTLARWRPFAHALYLDGAIPLPASVAARPLYEAAQPGRLGIGVLSRYPIVGERCIELGRPPRDRITRRALVLEVEAPEGRIRVVAVHMTHLSYGSPGHYLKLRRELAALEDGTPTVVLGDCNLWGWPVRLLLGRRRAVRGRTWPSWRPHSQIDHVLVDRGLEVISGQVAPDAGSDHRGVRATLRLA